MQAAGVEGQEAAAVDWAEPDENGRQAKVKRLLFPDHKPDALVLVGITETAYPPDAAVGMFLFNRLAGKPAEEKTNPLDESEAGMTERPPSRSELLEELFEMMISRWESRQSPRQVAPPAELAASAAS